MYDFLIDQASEVELQRLTVDLQQPGNNLVAFVGAGVSKQAGLPLWKELIADMERAAQRYARRPPHVRLAILRTSDMLWQAEFFRQELDLASKYEEFLQDRFKATLKQGKDVLQCLVHLNFRHFLTTNYDTLLQQAMQKEDIDYDELDWTNRQACRNFFMRYLSPETKRSIIHLHGRADQPASIILTHRDYVARYVASPEYVEKLAVLFATLRLVFIGFSLDDPDLKYILRQVNSRFGTGDVQNYAILGLPREMEAQAQVERERLERQFGISPIFYDDAAGHVKLGDVLRAMRPPPRAAVPPPAPAVEVSGGHSADRPKSPPMSEQSMWDSDPNQGRFGGVPQRNGRQLRVHDHRDEGGGLHAFQLTVEALAGFPPLTGAVVFHLHPTFARPIVEVQAENGQASLPVRAYGAFTVGVECDGSNTRLELDLATADGVFPAEFRAL